MIDLNELMKKVENVYSGKLASIDKLEDGITFSYFQTNMAMSAYVMHKEGLDQIAYIEMINTTIVNGFVAELKELDMDAILEAVEKCKDNLTDEGIFQIVEALHEYEGEVPIQEVIIDVCKGFY